MTRLGLALVALLAQKAFAFSEKVNKDFTEDEMQEYKRSSSKGSSNSRSFEEMTPAEIITIVGVFSLPHLSVHSRSEQSTGGRARGASSSAQRIRHALYDGVSKGSACTCAP